MRSAELSPPTVTLSMIAGRDAGKTALIRGMQLAMGKTLPSGNWFDGADPREVQRIQEETLRTECRLREAGLGTTVECPLLDYQLFAGGARRLRVVTHEVIGQVLTHTLPDSPASVQDLYNTYVERLRRSPTLWIGAPLPSKKANGHPRWESRMRTLRSFLLAALENRPSDAPTSVAILLFKVDAHYPTLAEARMQATDGRLKAAMAPLLDLARDCPCVKRVVLAPVSAFGFGNAVPLTPRDDQERAAIAAGERDIEWILRKDAHLQPFNLMPLLLWTCLAQLADRRVDAKRDAGLIDACRRMRSDLDSLESWLVPVKGGLD